MMHFASYYRWLVYQHLFGVPEHQSRTAYPQATVLDIGSDDGGFVERLPARLSIALDPVLDSLRRTRVQARVCADGRYMPFPISTVFAHVILSDVIEHVEDDHTLVAQATACVEPGGILWLSTTANQFQLFPTSITRRAERSWGHVRKGYTPSQITSLIGPAFDCEVVEWPEVVLRHSYMLLWACSKRMPALACRLAALCFQWDCRLRHVQQQHGHIYAQAMRHRAEL